MSPSINDNIAKVVSILIRVAALQSHTHEDEPWAHLHIPTQANLAVRGHNYLLDHIDDVHASLERMRKAGTPALQPIIDYLDNWLQMHADAGRAAAELLERAAWP